MAFRLNIRTFITLQLLEIQQGGRVVLLRKIKLSLQILFKVTLFILNVSNIFALPVVLILRAIRPWFLVRWGCLNSSRIGHFAANTELYLCERDAGINVPPKCHIDLFYMDYRPLCNKQLAIMWNRVLRVWPSWILSPIARVNRLIPGGAVHEIGRNTQHDRDVYNLLDRFPPHLQFTDEEEERGKAGLLAMGVPTGAPFVCLIVRDSAYLDALASRIKGTDVGYHSYRDSDIQNYVLAAEELADRGYYLIRMGAMVNEPISSRHKMVIDYATNGMRSDFMDIYLGAKCAFCISTGTGFDAVPYIFRRPIVYVNYLPLGYLYSFRAQFISITRHHLTIKKNQELSLRDIFSSGVGFSVYTSEYVSKGIKIIENTPEEIRDVAIEMAERLNGTWKPHEDDETLQRRFWEIFPVDATEAINKRPLHGEIRARFGAHFLRNNRDWLK
jgi:putative glycosyltransferase (TIGR04372 family)